MSHEMTENDGALQVGRPAWHRLGTVMQAPPANVKEALEVARMAWEVESAPVEVAGAIVKGYAANVRSDTREVLGIVSEGYRRVQNAEAFGLLDGARELGATIETVGSVRGGRIVYATVKLPASFAVRGDVVESYAAFVARHDGAGAVRAFATPVRIVCMNTIRAATSRADGAVSGTAESGLSIPHRGDVREALEQGSTVLQAMIESTGKIRAAAEFLAGRPIDPAGFRAYVERLDVPPVAPDADTFAATTEGIAAFDVAREKYEGARDRWAVRRARVGAIMAGSTGTIGGNVAGTWWAAYNAATEALQHPASGEMTDARAVSTFLGAGADRTAEALSVALSMAG
jgi:phage/plasmid-like protein (TIGR03299 family)